VALAVPGKAGTRTLSGTLLFGVRTFLPGSPGATVRSANQQLISLYQQVNGR